MTAIPRIDVDVKELNEILARCALSDPDREKLSAAIETLGWLTHELEAKRVSVARLKKLLFGQESEKTADVLSSDEAAPEDEPPDPAEAGAADESKD